MLFKRALTRKLNFRGKKSISYCTLLSVLWYLRQFFTFPTDIKNKIETKLATYYGIKNIVAFQKHILAFDWKRQTKHFELRWSVKISKTTWQQWLSLYLYLSLL